MGKQITKSQLASELAEKTGITKKSAEEVLNELATIAYREAANSFTIPGIGKLVVVDRKARMGRNPATGEAIQIPAKRALKFRIAKSCTDAVLKKPW